MLGYDKPNMLSYNIPTETGAGACSGRVKADQSWGSPLGIFHDEGNLSFVAKQDQRVLKCQGTGGVWVD